MTERIHDLCRLIEAAERNDDLERLISVAGQLYGEAIAEKCLPTGRYTYGPPVDPRQASLYQPPTP